MLRTDAKFMLIKYADKSRIFAADNLDENINYEHLYFTKTGTIYTR